MITTGLLSTILNPALGMLASGFLGLWRLMVRGSAEAFPHPTQLRRS